MNLPRPYLTYDTRRKIWILMFPYAVVLPGGWTFSLPQNFEFDLASIPRIIWPIISSFELSIIAPLIHDYFYQYKGATFYHGPRKVDRKTADTLFYNLMLEEGVAKWKAVAAYHAVRMFGPRW